MSIYVETLIDAPMDELWRYTQDPVVHQRWDLRFTSIEYLPRAEGEPQQFLYTTRIGFGLTIAGKGESVGSADLAGGERASALKFWSHSPLSLIESGSGYWKYIPDGSSVRFLTGYDYRARYGLVGRAMDRLVFRPLLGWATAWSFDRLRLWLEHGLDPATAARLGLAHAIARVTTAFVFAYHGLVPKLLARDVDELTMLARAGVPEDLRSAAMTGIGIAEIGFAAALLIFWRSTRLPLAVMVFMLAAVAGVASSSPHYLSGAFNPVSLNLALVALAAVDRMAAADAPFAGRCRRRPER